MADDEPEIEEVLDSLGQLLNKDEAEPSQQQKEAGPSSHRMELTESMLVEEPDEGEVEAPSPQQEEEAPSSHRVELTEAMLAEEDEVQSASDSPDSDSTEAPAMAETADDNADEIVPEEAVSDSVVEAEEATPEDIGTDEVAESAESPPSPQHDPVEEPEPEPAPAADSRDDAERRQPEASVQSPSDYGRMVDVDVLFGVMQQVSADVSARISEMLPDMIEEAMNRHLSGLKSDQDD